MQLANEYEKLLQYLEDNEPKVKKEKLITTKPVIESKIEEFKDIPSIQHYNQPKESTSKFFNVSEFEELMRQELIKEHISYQNYERPYISVSELYTCLRQNYYVRKKYQADIRKQYNFSFLYIIQKVGHAIHDCLQKLYNFTDSEKTVVSEKYKIKGRVDAIKDNVVFEIKTIDPPKYKGSVLAEHIYQGVVYAYILNTEYNYNIEYITVIYVPRTLKAIYPLDVKVDMKLGESLAMRAPILLDSLSNNYVVDPIGATEEQCKYCVYKDRYCKNENFQQIKPPFQQTKNKPELKNNPEAKKTSEAQFLL